MQVARLSTGTTQPPPSATPPIQWITPDTVSAVFTMVSAVAACIAIVSASRTAQRGHEFQRAERKSRHFAAVVLNPMQQAFEVFTRDLCALFPLHDAIVSELRADESALHQQVNVAVGRLATCYDLLYYDLSAVAQNCVAAWPDKVFGRELLDAIQQMQDVDQGSISALALRGATLLDDNSIRSRSFSIVGKMIQYDLGEREVSRWTKAKIAARKFLRLSGHR